MTPYMVMNRRTAAVVTLIVLVGPFGVGLLIGALL